MLFGERLRQLREGKYTQEELAEKMNVHNITISKWETGVQAPHSKRVAELARILGTTTAYLLGDTDNPDAEAMPVSNESGSAGRDISLDNKAGHLVFRNGNLTVDIPDTPENKTLYWRIVEKILSNLPVSAMVGQTPQVANA